MDSQMSVERSPLPELYRNIGDSGKPHFIAAAKLTAVLWLRPTGTVANVYDLELQLKAAFDTPHG
jgi:hypothetical protein